MFQQLRVQSVSNTSVFEPLCQHLAARRVGTYSGVQLRAFKRNSFDKLVNCILHDINYSLERFKKKLEIALFYQKL